MFSTITAIQEEQHCEAIEQIRLARKELRRLDQSLALAARAAQQAYTTNNATA